MSHRIADADVTSTRLKELSGLGYLAEYAFVHLAHSAGRFSSLHGEPTDEVRCISVAPGSPATVIRGSMVVRPRAARVRKPIRPDNRKQIILRRRRAQLSSFAIGLDLACQVDPRQKQSG